MSWCAVPGMLSVQSSAYHSLLRVNKPLANVCILQEATWDQSSGKVMGWDQGAAWLAGLCAPHQTQLGRGRLKRAMHKAGASVMQVESSLWGRGQHPGKQKRGEPPDPAGCRSCQWDPAFALHWPWQSSRAGRRCSVEEGREQALPMVEHELASEQPHLYPAGSRQPFLAACHLSPAASPLPAGRHPIPCPGWEPRGERWAEERTSALGTPIRPGRAAGLPPAPHVKRVFKPVLVSWTPSR